MKQSGFTHLELTASLVILSILLAIALPTYFGLMDKIRLNSAIAQLSQQWKATRYDAIGNGISPDTLCMKDSSPIQYAQISGNDCRNVSSWQTLPAGVTIHLSNSTLYSVNDSHGNKIYRVSWADTKGGYGGSSGRLGRITLTNHSRHQKCLFLYHVDGSWNIRTDTQCHR
jgi:prepilin-type N-terminal cleavage/methylation domain-containing protein